MATPPPANVEYIKIDDASFYIASTSSQQVAVASYIDQMEALCVSALAIGAALRAAAAAGVPGVAADAATESLGGACPSGLGEAGEGALLADEDAELGFIGDGDEFLVFFHAAVPAGAGGFVVGGVEALGEIGLAEDLCQLLLRRWPLVLVRVRIHKFILPDTRAVSVTLTRQPADFADAANS